MREVNLPTDAAALRALLGRPHRHAAARRDARIRILIRTDRQLELLAAAVNTGLAGRASCTQIAATLPPWADEALVRALLRATGLEHRLVRHGTWAQYHARKAASGEPYTCRRGKGISYD